MVVQSKLPSMTAVSTTELGSVVALPYVGSTLRTLRMHCTNCRLFKTPSPNVSITHTANKPAFPVFSSSAMPLVFALLVSVLFSQQIPACSAAAEAILAGEALVGDDKLVSRNGRFAFGFFQPDRKFSRHAPKHRYLGIWFDKISKLTPIWVANRENPIIEHHIMSKLTISNDGNLVIYNQATGSTVWSTHADITDKNTMVVLQDNGNLILRETSSSSNILWQSFDYPTNIMLPGAKFGQDKITGLNRRLVSKKSLADPAPGPYCQELDPTGANQLVFKLCNSSVVYWSSGEWNGQYFNSMPEMSGHTIFDFKFINNNQEEYFVFNLLDEKLISISLLDISGQNKLLLWLESKQEWLTIFTHPKDQCDVYATCGPFTICNSSTVSLCDCMKGFSISSPKDWELEDRSGGCIRNTPLDCITTNESRTATTDKFYPLPGIGLPTKANTIEAAGSADQCALACLNNCTCTAYSYGNRCSVWYDDLLNVRRYNNGNTSDGEIIYLRIAAKDTESWRYTKGAKGNSIGDVIAPSIAALGLLSAIVIWLLVIWRNKRKHFIGTSDNILGGNGIVAFRYTDLQHATKNFSEKLGGGSFGSVFKGFLGDSTAIAVKRLDGIRQGEKEFRAEVSSIGIIQHINLVKLIGFCCEGKRRLLVYEHMPNSSLDRHLFHSNNMVVLKWSVRYQIALGIARGLAYLHENCRDCIIHCDIKPQNILLDAMFVAKIADFGMAKFLGRDFSRVLTTLRGTIGYLAPEWISGVAITPKVDVYSYGMMLLEIISGRSNTCNENASTGNHSSYFPVQVASRLLEGDVASLLDDKLLCGVNLDEAERVCKVACWCIQDDESNRPTMGEVVQILEGLLELEIPPVPRLLQAIVGR